jgi:hypothetical protein
MSSMHLIRCGLASLALAAVASASVLVVSPGGAITQIQQAVNLASEGDTILVESGSYSGFTVNGLSLAIAGDAGSTVRVEGAVSILNLHEGQVVVLQNLNVHGPNGGTPSVQPAITLANDTGRVRIQGCSVIGGNADVCAQVVVDGGDAIHADSCDDVALIHCVSRGGNSTTDGNEIVFGIGGNGALATLSVLTAYESNVYGGDGSVCCDGSSGGNGLSLRAGSFLFGSGCQAIGAAGANAQYVCTCAYGGDGGDGVKLSGMSQAFVLAWTSQGGTYGHGSGGFGCIPSDGDGGPGMNEAIATGSSITHWAGTARTMTAPSPVHAGTNAALVLRGVPGEHVMLFVSDATLDRFIPSWDGVLLVDARPPHGVSVDLGFVPVGGVLSAQLPIADPGVPAKTFYLQAVFSDLVGTKQLGTPGCMVVLQ